MAMTKHNQQSNPINALFTPAAELLGEELRKKLEKVIQERQKKKEEEHKDNISKHIKKVFLRKKIISSAEFEVREELSVMQLQYIPEWVDGAQRVDPDDPDQIILAKLWQDILFGIASGYSFNNSLIGILQKLREQEAKLLIKLGKNSTININEVDNGSKFRIGELRSFGLVAPATRSQLISNSSFLVKMFFSQFAAVGGGFLAVLLLSNLSSQNTGTSLENVNNIFSIGIMFFIWLLLSYFLFKKIRKNFWGATVLGYQLLKFSPKKLKSMFNF